MRKSREKYLLYVGVGVALLPVLLFRDFTPPNELRYISIADEALRNHTFFTFSNHGTPYADKPPLYFWIVMLCRWVTGGHRMWLLSLFSLLPALGIVRVMDRWSVQELDGGRRVLARIMLLTCGLFIGAAVTLRMDMLMTFFIVLALRAFWRMSAEGDMSLRGRLLFPLFIFLAVFTKGPLGLLIPLCSTVMYLLLSGRISEFFRYWGWLTWGVLLAFFTLWFGAVCAEGGSGYLYDLIFQQTVGRAINSFHHAGPFYYYAVSFWYSLAPWSLLVAGVVAASLRPSFVRSDLQRLFLTVGITSFVLLSCISSKLQIYLLPAIPFFVYATVMFLPRFREGGLVHAALAVPASAFAVALPALEVLSKVESTSYLNEGMLHASATILTLSGVSSLYLLYNKRNAACIGVVIRRIGAGLLLALFAAGWALPSLNARIGYGTLCGEALKISRERGICDFRTWRISRSENMDVYLHRPVTIIKGDHPPVQDNCRPFVLLTRRRELDKIHGHEARIVGQYALVIYP